MRKLAVALLFLPWLFCSSCSMNPNIANVELRELGNYVFEVEEYKSLDCDFAREYFAKNYDNWNTGGCSAVSKMVNGHRLVGRNMDLDITNKCAYIIRTNAGKYKTIGIAYTFKDISPDYEIVKEHGVSKEFYKILPFMCDDVLNNEGLHVEVNMRYNECGPSGSGKFGCQGTNSDFSSRVYVFGLPRYIAENCATVEEAKRYVASLNVYSKNYYWGYCFLISDSKGNSSLLELSENRVNWLDESDISKYTWLSNYNAKAIGQTNFYLNKDAWAKADNKSGEGRFISLQNGIGAVNSRSDMYKLMKKVQYSSVYLDYDDCKSNHFDPRSEGSGEFSRDILTDPKFEDLIRQFINERNAKIRALSRQEKQDAGKYWESTFTEVVDTNSKAIFVRMFENEDMLYLIDFNGTKKVNSISDWVG